MQFHLPTLFLFGDHRPLLTFQHTQKLPLFHLSHFFSISHYYFFVHNHSAYFLILTNFHTIKSVHTSVHPECLHRPYTSSISNIVHILSISSSIYIVHIHRPSVHQSHTISVSHTPVVDAIKLFFGN